MSDVPVQLIVAAFNDEKTANAALKELKAAQHDKVIRIEDAAVLRKDEKGKLHIKETGDMGGGKGAAFGGVAGAAIGIIAGPALVVWLFRSQSAPLWAGWLRNGAIPVSPMKG